MHQLVNRPAESGRYGASSTTEMIEMDLYQTEDVGYWNDCFEVNNYEKILPTRPKQTTSSGADQ